MDEKTYAQKIGERIWDLRQENGYSREKLAELADMSTSYLYEVETGKKGPSANMVAKIAKVFGVGCGSIMDGIL